MYMCIHTHTHTNAHTPTYVHAHTHIDQTHVIKITCSVCTEYVGKISQMRNFSWALITLNKKQTILL